MRQRGDAHSQFPIPCQVNSDMIINAAQLIKLGSSAGVQQQVCAQRLIGPGPTGPMRPEVP